MDYDWIEVATSYLNILLTSTSTNGFPNKNILGSVHGHNSRENELFERENEHEISWNIYFIYHLPATGVLEHRSI